MPQSQSRRPKVLICTSFYEPEKGAAPHRVTAMAAALNAEVTVITPLANYPTGKIFPGQFGKVIGYQNLNGVRVKRYWIIPTNSNSALVRMVSMLVTGLSAYLTTSKHLLTNNAYDKIIIQTPPLTSAFAYQLAVLPFRGQSVLNVSDVWPSTAVDLGVLREKSISWRAFNFMEFFLYRNATRLIAQSEETFNYLSSKSESPVTLYRNLTPPLKTTTKIKSGKVKIIYAGLLGMAQDVKTLCTEIDWEAINTELHVYGDGNQKEFISNLNTPGVFYHSPIPKTQVQELMGQFDFSLVPLKTYIFGAFPSKITAAVASCIPVLFVGQGEGATVVETLQIGKAFDFDELKALSNYLVDYGSNREADSKAFQRQLTRAQNHTFNVEINNRSLNHFLFNS